MQTILPRPLLLQLSELITSQMGLHYPPARLGDLERGIAAAAPALGVLDTATCVRQLLSGSLTRKKIEILACQLTVGETYFFREKRSLEILEEHILPELMRACARANRPLRIWSAGCCTGEEPYSIAMLLDRLIRPSGEWNATILATDINPIFLQKAAAGLYGEWSFRDTPPWIREQYFKQRKNGQFEILPHIRKRVTFSYLNLAEDLYPSLINNTNAMDLIFCRNVLMYFSPEWINKIGQNFHRSLVNGGWLLVSPAEVSNSLYAQFKNISFPGAVLYRKNENPALQVNKIEHPESAPDRSSHISYIPAPAVAQSSCLEETMPLPPEKLKEILATAASTSFEPVKARELTSVASLEKVDGFCERARSHANLGELAEAFEWCEKAIAANKLNPSAHFLLGTIHQELGQSEIAIQSLTRALYLDPNFVLAHFALGNLRLSQGRHDEAGRHFDNALALLRPYPDDRLLPESDGLTARRLTEIVASLRSSLPLRSWKNKERKAT